MLEKSKMRLYNAIMQNSFECKRYSENKNNRKLDLKQAVDAVENLKNNYKEKFLMSYINKNIVNLDLDSRNLEAY